MNNSQTPSDAKYDFRGQPQYMKYFFKPGATIRACIKERQQTKEIVLPLTPYYLIKQIITKLFLPDEKGCQAW